MASSIFPQLPPILKPVQMSMKIASDHEKTDPIIAYWCRFYAVQKGLKIDSKSKESVLFLTTVMDWLEKEKKARSDNEAITNEMVAQAHVENYALDLFNKADSDDRAANITRNTLRLFLISSVIFEVLSVFGEVSDDILKRAKYAKWKAFYINNCFKTGETPQPGPVAGTDAEEFDVFNTENNLTNQNSSTTYSNEQTNTNTNSKNLLPTNSFDTEPMPRAVTPTPSVTALNGVNLGHEELVKAQKYCKFAGSALQYEDIPTAVSNLRQALSILTTGDENN